MNNTCIVTYLSEITIDNLYFIANVYKYFNKHRLNYNGYIIIDTQDQIRFFEQFITRNIEYVYSNNLFNLCDVFKKASLKICIASLNNTLKTYINIQRIKYVMMHTYNTTITPNNNELAYDVCPGISINRSLSGIFVPKVTCSYSDFIYSAFYNLKIVLTNPLFAVIMVPFDISTDVNKIDAFLNMIGINTFIINEYQYVILTPYMIFNGQYDILVYKYNIFFYKINVNLFDSVNIINMSNYTYVYVESESHLIECIVCGKYPYYCGTNIDLYNSLIYLRTIVGFNICSYDFDNYLTTYYHKLLCHCTNVDATINIVNNKVMPHISHEQREKIKKQFQSLCNCEELYRRNIQTQYASETSYINVQMKAEYSNVVKIMKRHRNIQIQNTHECEYNDRIELLKKQQFEFDNITSRFECVVKRIIKKVHETYRLERKLLIDEYYNNRSCIENEYNKIFDNMFNEYDITNKLIIEYILSQKRIIKERKKRQKKRCIERRALKRYNRKIKKQKNC
jgi:hypothetical protein